MHFSFPFRSLVALMLVLVAQGVNAQTPGPSPTPAPTSAKIGYLRQSDILNFVEPTFSGVDAFIDTSQAFFGNFGINAVVKTSSDPLGQSGNAIIVTPISDPVIFFNNITFQNQTGALLKSLTLTLPQPGAVDLGFIDDGTGAGIVGSNAFEVEYLDYIGEYFGDYLPYNGTSKKVYNKIRFFQGAGLAEIPDGLSGRFSFTATFPAPPPGSVPTSYGSFIATSANGSPTATAVTPEVPGVVQLVAGLLPVAGVLGLRRRKRGSAQGRL